jgi:hypothetical protein
MKRQEKVNVASRGRVTLIFAPSTRRTRQLLRTGKRLIFPVPDDI